MAISTSIRLRGELPCRGAVISRPIMCRVPSGNVAPIALDHPHRWRYRHYGHHNVINELQAARDYLEDEAERVCRANARYATWLRLHRRQPRLSARVWKRPNPELDQRSFARPPSLNAPKDLEDQREAAVQAQRLPG